MTVRFCATGFAPTLSVTPATRSSSSWTRISALIHLHEYLTVGAVFLRASADCLDLLFRLLDLLRCTGNIHLERGLVHEDLGAGFRSDVIPLQVDVLYLRGF